MEIPNKQRILKLFGESAIITDNEKEEARSYLNSWKKYLLRRLHKDSHFVKVIDEQWGEIPAHSMGVLCQTSSIYLKMIIEFEWQYSDEGSCRGVDIYESDLTGKCKAALHGWKN
jgi:hypothetical protein